jgi:hypothetical protein
MKHLYIMCLVVISVLTGVTSVSACTSLSSNLGIGNRSEQTRILQIFLTANGYESFSPTGFYGARTTAAVRAFQSAHNIQATGFVGSLTRAQIQKNSCRTAAQTPQAVACTMEARLCSDGTMMPRSATTCEWFPEQCRASNSVQSSTPSASYWNTWDSKRAQPLDSATQTKIREALLQVGFANSFFATTTLSEAEVIEQTKKFEKEYILPKQ